MLTGEYAHTIDTKGRIILPADFRAALGEHFVITRGLDHCLFIFDENSWKAFSEKLSQLPISDLRARNSVRFFFSGARTLECDRQGRFLVPGNLRTYASLEKEVVLIGNGKRIEVWCKKNWDEMYEKMADDPEMFENLGI